MQACEIVLTKDGQVRVNTLKPGEAPKDMQAFLDSGVKFLEGVDELRTPLERAKQALQQQKAAGQK